jgi:hypothetical protein
MAAQRLMERRKKQRAKDHCRNKRFPPLCETRRSRLVGLGSVTLKDPENKSVSEDLK